MNQSSLEHVKGVIEALLFVNEKPVVFQQIKEILEGVSANEIKAAVAGLQRDYENRKSGIAIVEIAEGYQMLSNSAYASYIRSFYKTRHKEKLSKPALETLAIIAYKQPVTRNDIELIRGVNSDGVMVHLLSKELIKAVGRKDVAGRPYLYGTTKLFLEYFGLKSLTDMPRLESIAALQPVGAEVGQSGASEDTGGETDPENPPTDVNNLKEAMEEIEQRDLPPGTEEK